MNAKYYVFYTRISAHIVPRPILTVLCLLEFIFSFKYSMQLIIHKVQSILCWVCWFHARYTLEEGTNKTCSTTNKKKEKKKVLILKINKIFKFPSANTDLMIFTPIPWQQSHEITVGYGNSTGKKIHKVEMNCICV